MATARDKRPRRKPQTPSTGSGAGRAAIGIVAVVALAVAGFYFLRRDDRMTETLDLQKQVLAQGLDPRQQRQAIDRIIRNVDQMSADRAREVRDALYAEWQQAQKERIEAYFAATGPGERQAILDRDIDLQGVLADLRFAAQSQPWGARPRRKGAAPRADAKPKQQRSGGEPALSPAELELAKSLENMAREYQAALLRRGQERGVTLTRPR